MAGSTGPAPPIHASAVVLGRQGVLIEGPSGAGKSMLAHHLVSIWRARGQFARWVSDDQTLVDVKNGRVIARAPARIAGLAELHFAGVVAVVPVPSAIIDLAVELVDARALPRMAEERLRHETLPLAQIRVPGRDAGPAVHLIEACLSPQSVN